MSNRIFEVKQKAAEIIGEGFDRMRTKLEGINLNEEDLEKLQSMTEDMEEKFFQDYYRFVNTAERNNNLLNLSQTIESIENNKEQQKTPDNKPKEYHKVIWSNINLDIDKWRVDLIEQHPYFTEDELIEQMHEDNDMFLDDERMNLNIQLNQEIIIIADLGLWDGRRMGYKEITSGNLADCLSLNDDYMEWYVDENDEFKGEGHHHDGTNYYTYRRVRAGATENQIETLKDKLYNGTATQSDIDRVTLKLGPSVRKVYGWEKPVRINRDEHTK